MHPGPLIKLATLLMLHSITVSTSTSTPVQTYLYQFVLTGPPSQFNRLMVSTKVDGPWTQLNQPDGNCGQRDASGSNFIIPNQPDCPTLFFTLKPAP